MGGGGGMGVQAWGLAWGKCNLAAFGRRLPPPTGNVFEQRVTIVAEHFDRKHFLEPGDGGRRLAARGALQHRVVAHLDGATSRRRRSDLRESGRSFLFCDLTKKNQPKTNTN